SACTLRGGSICGSACAAARRTKRSPRSSPRRGAPAQTAGPRSAWACASAARCIRSSRCAPTRTARCTPGEGELPPREHCMLDRSRDDLVRTNAAIVKQVSQQIKQHCPHAIVVVVSNPLDVMCWVTKQVTGFPRERVIGMAGVLDTARYRAFLAEALDVSVEDIQAMVLGGHGDTMVPLVSYTTVSGIPVSQLLD